MDSVDIGLLIVLGNRVTISATLLIMSVTVWFYFYLINDIAGIVATTLSTVLLLSFTVATNKQISTVIKRIKRR